VDDNGSAGAARWSFDISAGGTKVISLPQRNYYEDHKPSDGSKKKSFLPQSSSSPRQSAAQDGTASGSWCITEGQSFSISVAGTRDGEKEPEKAFARGERTVTALPQSFSVTVRANTVRQSEGSFTFYFIIIPISPQERK
jgi:hypothetical protein